MLPLETGSTNPPFNLAVEEALLAAVQPGEPGWFLLWQNSPAVIIGRHQDARSEVNLAELDRRNIALVRRMTGGGAVYHDYGNLNFSFILPLEAGEEPRPEELLAPLLHYLRGLGLDVVMAGRNDLSLKREGQLPAKVSGLAGRRLPGKYQLHGTLLFAVDLSMLEKVLRVDPEKFRSKGVASLRARVANLKPYLALELPELWAGIQKAYGGNPSALPEEIREAAHRLAREKYAAKAWNIGQAPPGSLVLKKRFAFGSLELHLDTAKNRIRTATITGDFLTPGGAGEQIPVEKLAEALKGLPADAPEAWATAWQDIDMRRIFYGQAEKEEILAWLRGATNEQAEEHENSDGKNQDPGLGKGCKEPA